VPDRAISFPSVLLAVVAAAGCGALLGPALAWPVASFAATVVYVLVDGSEMLLGERGVAGARGRGRARLRSRDQRETTAGGARTLKAPGAAVYSTRSASPT
jgi:hypothetical protein